MMKLILKWKGKLRNAFLHAGTVKKELFMGKVS